MRLCRQLKRRLAREYSPDTPLYERSDERANPTHHSGRLLQNRGQIYRRLKLQPLVNRKAFGIITALHYVRCALA